MFKISSILNLQDSVQEHVAGHFRWQCTNTQCRRYEKQERNWP